MVLGEKDRIPEEDEHKSGGKRGDDENKEAEKKPLYTRKELKDKLWKITGEGHSDDLLDILQKVKDFENLELLLNEENEDFDEDGNNLLLYCIKEGCDSGPAWGRHFHKCAEILIENNVNINYHNKAGHTPLFEAVFHKNTSYITMLLHHKAESDRCDQDGLDPLHLAIHLGYKNCFKLLVQHENQEIYNRKDGNGVPPLVAAVQHGHLDLCRLLLDGGCDVNASDKKLQRNALHYAVIAKRFDLFELILKYKPKLDHSDHKGRTVLHRVCAIPEPRYLKKLLHGGFDITTSLMDQESDDGLTPVIIACQNGNAEQLKDLLEEGSSVTTTDKTGKSSLHYCADNLETQCAEMLLMRDESLIHIQDEQGFTPLHMAVIGGNVPLLKLLVRKGADVNVLDSDGHTPSHWATVCTHLEILDVLIENDAELSKCDNHNAYPIHYAAQMNGRDNGHSDVKIGEKVLKKLLDSRIPFDVLDKDRRQPLLWAASAGNSDSCKLLVNAGADVNSIDKDGLTALHCAASRGHSDCVDRLKKLGAEVNVADTNGCTALFYAITLGNKECTRLLLKYGADPNHKDSRGRTPTHCAAIKGCLETIKMLDKSKADLWFSSFRGDCPIHEAAQGGHCDVVKYLLKAKNTPEAVNTANDAGRTCLHISAIVNNLQLCKLLLDNNADKNSIMKNKDKSYTPYDAAIIKGNNEIAEYIRSKGGVTGGDIDNILQAKGKKRDAKSAKSRKSVQTLESTPEEAEPEDNKKVDEKTKVEPVEDDKKKKDKGKKKEKEEKEREKEKLVIVPKDKQKKKDQEEKGKEDQKESEKEKADEDKEGKGEKKDLTDKELKELQDRIKAGEVAVDERDIKRKAIKDLGEKQKLDDVVEEDQEEKEKEKDLTEEEQKDLEAKIKAGQSDLDERDKKQKEGKETEDQKKKDKNKTDKKEGEKDTKGKKKDLSDKEQKAGQKKVKSGDKTERDKKQKKTEEEKKEKGGKPDLTDTEVAAITAAVVIATDKDKKDQDQKTKDRKDQDLKTKDKKDQDQKTKDQKDQDQKTKDKDQFEGLAIPPSSPDLRDPKQKTKDKKEQDQKTKDGINQDQYQDQKTKDKKDQDQKTKDKKDQDLKAKDKTDQDQKIKDKKDQDQKTKDKKDQDQKTKDKDQFEGLDIPPSSPDLRDPKQKTKDKKDQDQKSEDEKDQDQKVKDRKDQDQKTKDKKDQDQFEGLAIPPSSPDLRDPKQKTKDKKDQDQKSKDEKDQDQKIKDKKDQDQKIKDKKDQDQKTKDKKDQDQLSKDKKDQDQTTKRKEDQFEGTDIPPSSPDLSDSEQKRKEKDKDDQASGEDTSDRDQDQESSEERADELDSKETRKKRGSGKQDIKGKKEVHVQIPVGAFERSPVATASNRSRRDSPVKYRGSRSRSKSSDAEEFEFPEGAHENTEAAIAAAEARRKARERSRSRSADRESVERQTELRKYSKVNTDGRIQPGLLAEKNGRNRRFDERDTPSPLDSEDEFIDDPYFGRRIKTYGGGLRLGNKRIDNREKILREKAELKRKRQLEKMSRSSQRLPSRGGVSRMLPLGYSRLETPQRPITRKSNSIQESVRRYQTERTFVRQLHQLKRAQIYTGPMHDIVLFSKLMDVYKNSSANDSELDIDSQALDDWDGYLQDQLRFVSHYYEDDRTGLRDIKGDAKEYHHQLEKSATDAKKTVESRIDHIIKQNEKDETTEREEREKLDKKISNIAEKTGHMLDSVRQQANESVAGARDLNSSLEEEMRRERQDRLKHSKYSGRNEKAWLLEQEAIDNRQSRMDEQDKERKEKHKEWMRKKDEEMRRKLMKVYGPTPVFDPFVSKKTSLKASTPKPNFNLNSRSSSRPKSMMSSISGSRSRPQDQELEVHMTEFGMRRVKRDEFSFAKMSTPQSQSYVRHAAVLPDNNKANWTPKYDGINLRPRAGLVFVEPTIYDEVLKEEQMIRTGKTRNSTRNLTLETDNNMLETVDL